MAAKKAPAKPAKKAAKKTTEAKAPRVKQPESNGISRPKEGTTTGAIWAIADKLSSKGNPATRAQVIEEAAKKNINEATVATQYQRWRQFNGLPGRQPAAAKPVKKAAAKKAPAKKAPAKKSAPAAPAAPVV